MRVRFVLLAVLAAAVALAAPAAASAKRHRHNPPRHNRGLTIAATPNPISTGEPVLIYGQLNGPNHAGVRITLWHHINRRTRGFTVVQRTTTDANGFWSIARAPGVVTTNRDWFATAGHGVHSRTVHERVRATVTLADPGGPLTTRTPVTFTGTVAPAGIHVGERVVLQEQVGVNGDQWRTIDQGRIGPGSAFSIVHRFRQPGDHTLRAVFRGDRRNIEGDSTPISVTVQQQQAAGFTINGSAPSIDFGQPVTISGVLSGGANASVTLFGRDEQGGGLQPLAAGTTDASGNYSFTQSPPRNTIYQVRVTTTPATKTALLFVGVHDVVSITASTTSGKVGDAVMFTGTVLPNKTGHVVFLQRMDGSVWRTIAVGRVRSAPDPGAGSVYALAYVLDSAGSIPFRVLVPGGPVNQRGISPAVTIAVVPSAASTLNTSGTLPPAS